MKTNERKKQVVIWIGILFFSFFRQMMFAQDYPVKAKIENKNSFSMILIPDPQSYIKFDANQPLFELQTAWIANSLESLQIKTALCLGDLVEQNDVVIPDNRNGNQTSKQQWKSVSRAFERLDNKLPYILATGNHDYGYKSSEYRRTHFSEYFTPERNSCWRKILVEIGTDSHGKRTLENAAYQFKTKTWGNLLVLSLEFAPRDEALEWAKKICLKYKKDRIILLTHSFLETNGKRFFDEDYKMKPANYGQAIWDKLVYTTPNIRMVVCGHACNTGDYKQNVSFRVDENVAGNKIPQMMFNAQTADRKWFGNGGDCWLRILEFLPDGKTVKVRTFSPMFALSPLTSDKAWRKDKYDQFYFFIEK